jgi:gliding motility-associated-like protein
LASVTVGSTGSGILTYWTNLAATSGLASPMAIAVSGTYYIKSTLGTCSDIKPVVVTVSDNQPINSVYYLCIDKAGLLIAPVTIDSNLSPSQYSFAWTFNGDPISTTTSSYPASTLGTYQVIATDLSGGCVKILIADVKESNEATATATVGTDFDNQQEIIVTVTGGLGNYSYQLNDGLIQKSNIFSVSQGGEYNVNVIDNLGCNNFILDVTVLNYPRFFTPNGDGFHDTWNISGLPKPDKSVIFIFDRYGKLLKEIAPLGEGWDGIYNSHVLPSTDYWFKILYQDAIGVNKEFKAHFSLKR